MASAATTRDISFVSGLRTYSQLAKLTDEELLGHLKQGHHDALAVLFDRHHRLVLNVARRILRDLSEAEDVTQTVFLEIFRAAAQFDPSRGSAKVWVLQYAYHRSFNRRHYLKIRGFYDLAKASEPQPTPFHSLNGLSPQESARLVDQGLETLPIAQRTALELAFFEGLTKREIARLMGQSVANVRHYYYRGLARLRGYLSSGLRSRREPPQHREVIDVKS